MRHNKIHKVNFILVQRFLPTKLCFSVSHSGAARTPLATKAKNAFLTCQAREIT